MIKHICSLFLLCVCFSCSQPAEKEIIFTKNAPSPIGPYSQAVRSGNTLYVSGQIGIRPDGSFDSTSIENETKQVLENLRQIILAAGLEMKNINKATIYLTDLKNFSKVNKIYSEYFSDNFPARETVQVSALPKNAHVEISVIAK